MRKSRLYLKHFQVITAVDADIRAVRVWLKQLQRETHLLMAALSVAETLLRELLQLWDRMPAKLSEWLHMLSVPEHVIKQSEIMTIRELKTVLWQRVFRVVVKRLVITDALVTETAQGLVSMAESTLLMVLQ